MKASTLNKSSWLLAVIFASLACLAYPQKSLAADTAVTCTAPVVIEWATGAGPTPKPNVVIDCTGGSSAGFQFFAYRYDVNPNFANSIPALVGFYVLEHGPGASITLSSNLSDTSGNNWGCGGANCRILNQVWGY
jgi:hypothetical protein